MLSLQRRYLNLDISKLIDRLEPFDDSSHKGSKYYGNVNETIEEEISDHDDEADSKSLISYSSRSSNKIRKHNRNIDDKYRGENYLSFMQIISDRVTRAKSHICNLENETIFEVLEEQDPFQQKGQSSLK